MLDHKTSVIAYVSSFASFFLGWIASNAALVGAMCAIATALVNLYYKHRHMKLIERQSDRAPFPSIDLDS